jgi:putative solute:sodium symporter small subunit
LQQSTTIVECPRLGAFVRFIGAPSIRASAKLRGTYVSEQPIWFVVSYLFGIILVEPLNSIQIGGYKLGFWFAQQGSIYVFIALIFYYAKRMGKLDKEHDVHEDDD